MSSSTKQPFDPGVGNRRVELIHCPSGKVTVWDPPKTCDGVHGKHVEEIRNRFAVGSYLEDFRSADWVGHMIAEALGLNDNEPAVKERIKGFAGAVGWQSRLKIEEHPDSHRQAKKVCAPRRRQCGNAKETVWRGACRHPFSTAATGLFRATHWFFGYPSWRGAAVMLRSTAAVEAFPLGLGGARLKARHQRVCHSPVAPQPQRKSPRRIAAEAGHLEWMDRAASSNGG